MTRLLEKALEVAKDFSPEKQDEVAWGIFAMVDDDENDVHILSDEERTAIERSRQSAARGEFASDEAVKAIFDKYRL